MSVETYLFSRALTDDELAEIEREMTVEAVSPNAPLGLLACIAFYRIVAREHGHDSIEGLGEFSAWQCRIPESQWHSICTRIIELTKAVDPLSGVNAALDWMSRGPSGTSKLDDVVG